MRRIISLIILGACIISLASCDRRYDENEVREAAALLLEESKLLNEIFYGSGIPYINDESRADGAYYEADYSYTSSHGIQTVEDIKEMARAVFSEGYCEQIFSTILSPVGDDDKIYYMARYYQKTDSLSGENISIMVYSLARIFLYDSYEYDLSSITVDGSKGERVYISVGVNVTDSETGELHTVTRSIALIEEEDGWRVDSPTYAQYSKENAYYDELQNNK